MNEIEEYANTQFELDTFYGYCWKYGIPIETARFILRSFYSEKPEFKVQRKKYVFQDKGAWGFRFRTEDSVYVTIELQNYEGPGLKNVTWIGFE